MSVFGSSWEVVMKEIGGWKKAEFSGAKQKAIIEEVMIIWAMLSAV